MYFEDWNRNHRLVVPESLWVDIMSEVHNTITEAEHGGYPKTYNWIAGIYYWLGCPGMSSYYGLSPTRQWTNQNNGPNT